MADCVLMRAVHCTAWKSKHANAATACRVQAQGTGIVYALYWRPEVIELERDEDLIFDNTTASLSSLYNQRPCLDDNAVATKQSTVCVE